MGVTPHIRSGKLRALAVTTAQRARSLPSVPTFAESGVKGFDAAQRYGVLAPAGTPVPIIDRLHRAVVVALGDAELIERMASDGSEPVGSTPAQFAAHIRAEMACWKTVIEQTGIKVE